MRHFNRNLVMVIHLQELYLTTLKDKYKYGLNEQAWTILPIFSDKYCHTGAFQLPLFYGQPTIEILAQIAKRQNEDWFSQAIESDTVCIFLFSIEYYKRVNPID